MNVLPTYVHKYLFKRSLDKWNVISSERKLFNNIIVVPALAEFENIKKLLHSLTQNDRKYFNNTLILFVVNNCVSADDKIKTENTSTLNYLNGLILNQINDNVSGNVDASTLNVAYVDASTSGFEMPDKEGGVGFARKIGMDLALTLFDYNSEMQKLIICLDADCTVSENYITAIVDYFNNNTCSAAVVNYQHPLDDEDSNPAAIICYEIFLRYYQLGLSYANSSYAFHTIGSTMICDTESYIKIGGMNKLKAAEDFYFLEKLAKITDIHHIKNAFVYPSSRSSFRVPFGTGQRVNRFLSQVRDEYLLYDPKSFTLLKSWLHHFETLNCFNLDEILNRIIKIDSELHKFLIDNKIELFWKKLCSQKLNDNQIRKQKYYWFDAFKTLKLIHHLRDTSYPLINMFDAIDQLLELYGIDGKISRNKNSLPGLDKQKEYLLLLRKLQN